MYGTGTSSRQEGAKAEATKSKRDVDSDILNPQIQALGAMDEVLDNDNNAKLSTKGQEDWRFNLATMDKTMPRLRSFPRKNAVRLKKNSHETGSLSEKMHGCCILP